MALCKKNSVIKCNRSFSYKQNGANKTYSTNYLYNGNKICKHGDMENFIIELLALNVGLTNIQASGLIVDIADIRESLSYSIPDLLQLLENTMPDNLHRISDNDWRNLFGIGIQITSPDSSPPSTDASR